MCERGSCRVERHGFFFLLPEGIFLWFATTPPYFLLAGKESMQRNRPPGLRGGTGRREGPRLRNSLAATSDRRNAASLRQSSPVLMDPALPVAPSPIRHSDMAGRPHGVSQLSLAEADYFSSFPLLIGRRGQGWSSRRMKKDFHPVAAMPERPSQAAES